MDGLKSFEFKSPASVMDLDHFRSGCSRAAEIPRVLRKRNSPSARCAFHCRVRSAMGWGRLVAVGTARLSFCLSSCSEWERCIQI